jgi:hypothetical protein
VTHDGHGAALWLIRTNFWRGITRQAQSAFDIDADWSDTEAFISAGSGVAKVEAEQPSPAILLAALANSLDALQREAAPTRLNRVRGEILSAE